MKIRTIKPEFWRSKDVARLSHSARLLFIGLWNLADDDGNEDRDPRRLRLELFGDDEWVTDEDVASWFRELVEAGLVTEYEGRRLSTRNPHVNTSQDMAVTTSSHSLYHVVTWSVHQWVPKRAAPRWEPPSKTAAQRSDSQLTLEGTMSTHGHDHVTAMSRPGVDTREREREREREKEREPTGLTLHHGELGSNPDNQVWPAPNPDPKSLEEEPEPQEPRTRWTAKPNPWANR